MPFFGTFSPVVDDAPTSAESYDGLAVRHGMPIPPKATIGRVGDIAAVRKCVTLICSALNPTRTTWDVRRKVRENGYTYYEPLKRRHRITQLFDEPSVLLDTTKFWDTAITTYATEGTVVLIKLLDRTTRDPSRFWMGIGRPAYRQPGLWDILPLPHPRMADYPDARVVQMEDINLIPLAWPGTGWPLGAQVGPSPLAKHCQLASELLLREVNAVSKNLQYQTYRGAFIKLPPGRIQNLEKDEKLAKANVKAIAAALELGVPPTLMPGSEVSWPGGAVVNADANFKSVTDLAVQEYARAYGLPVEHLDPKGSTRSWREVLDDAYRGCYSVHASTLASAFSHALLSPSERRAGLRVVIDVPIGGTPYEKMQLADLWYGKSALGTQNEGRMMVGFPPRGPEGDVYKVLPRGTGPDLTGNGGAEAAEEAREDITQQPGDTDE